MPSEKIKSKRTLKSIQTRTTYKRRTKNFPRETCTGSPEVPKTETITSRTVRSHKQNDD